SDAELARANQLLQPLFLRGGDDLSRGEADYAGALAVLVHDYESRRFPLPDDSRPVHERLKDMVEEAGMTQAALASILGCSRPLVSLMLSGRRELSKDNIRKLADHFKVSPALFLRPVTQHAKSRRLTRDSSDAEVAAFLRRVKRV